MPIRQPLQPIFFLILNIIGIFAVCYFVISQTFLSILLVLMIISPLLAALFYPRWMYLFLLSFTTLAAAGVLYWQQAPIEIFVGLPGLTALCVVILSEIILFANRKRMRQEEKLIENENRLEQFVEHSQDGIIMINEDGTVIDWNPAMEHLSGLKRSDVVGKPAWDIFFRLAPDDHKSRAEYERIRSNFQAIMKTGQITAAEHPEEQTLQRPDGGKRYVQELPFTMRNHLGHRLGIIIRDVTNRHSEERTLRQINSELLERIHHLEELNREASLLNEMGDLLQSCLNVEDAYAVLKQFAEKIFPSQAGTLYVLNNIKNMYESVVDWGNPVPGESEFEPDACWSLRRGRVHVVTDPNNRLFCQHLGPHPDTQRLVPYLCVPMTAQGETLGVLHLQTAPHTLVEPTEKLATTVGVRLALTLVNLRLRETLRLQSIRDPLTGLFNRRYMEETLERELHRAARHQHPLGVVMLDIDYFKKFNDEYGHEAGDALLRELGQYLQANVRSEDVAARYGGEEFILILPEATLEDTVRRTLKLREGINALKVMHMGQQIGPITVSQGVASFPDHGASAGQILRAVDAALYRAKRGGRDRVIVAEK